jgi:glucose/arabinose dehydrogenase
MSNGLLAIIIFVLFSFSVFSVYLDYQYARGILDYLLVPVFGQQQQDGEEVEREDQFSRPELNDQALRIEPFVEGGLLFPTSMIFLDNDTLLITQKEDGNVRAVINGTLKSQPIISVDVDTRATRGLLGITALEKSSTASSTSTKLVFLYYTESLGQEQVRNRIYSYEWNQENQTLVNPMLISDLPAGPGLGHNGGKIKTDQDATIYAVIGDLFREGQLQNVQEAPADEGSSVIIHIMQNGSAAAGNPFSNSGNEWMQKYYAYGIRNSFGLAIDPITGFLWDTENGDDSYDEINIVYPGFNSGWNQIMGPISDSDREQSELEEELVVFEGSRYADPVFSWEEPVGVTDLEFLNSTELGPEYAYNLFVGDINNGNLYYFKLNDNRTGIQFDAKQSEEGLTDLVADDDQEVSRIIFGTGFGGGITDIETGPDGLLYVLTFNGNIYRILPAAPGNVLG